MELTLSLEAEPAQTSGSYRAWSLGEGHRAIDLAWHSVAGHGDTVRDHCERQDLLPFTEPSIAIRRRFSRAGYTQDWDFVIFRAQPDGGAYDPAGGEELFALRLAPEVMERAFDLKAVECLAEDRAVPAKLVAHLDPAARLADEGDFAGAWAQMHDALLKAAAGTELDKVGHAAGLARRSQGKLGPAHLAEASGLSLRHMRRCFVDRLGLSPRAVLRRHRLTRAMLDAERAARPAWADLAAAHNFSDQAHLIRECRSLTGKSPVEWHRARRQMAVSFNI